jgi:hypothetical protein
MLSTLLEAVVDLARHDAIEIARNAPTFGEIDISLSFRMIRSFSADVQPG